MNEDLCVEYAAFTHPLSRYFNLNQDSYLCHEHSINPKSSQKKNSLKDEKSMIKEKKRMKKKNTLEYQDNSDHSFSFYDGGCVHNPSTSSPTVHYSKSMRKESKIQMNRMFCWSIFDGHDVLGDYASKKARETFEHHLSSIHSSQLSDSDIKRIFLHAHKEIIDLYDHCPDQCVYIAPNGTKLSEYKHEKKGNRSVYTSQKVSRPLEFGTTALLCILFYETKEIMLCWCGDSKAIFISKDENTSDFYEEEITECHNHKNNKERSRILKLNLDHVDINKQGYMIHVNETHRHILSVTRSLGHSLYSEYGIIPEPQIKRIKLSQNQKYLIIGSDGLWDYFGVEEIIEIVKEKKDEAAIIETILEKAIGMSKKISMDNITVIVVKLEWKRVEFEPNVNCK